MSRPAIGVDLDSKESHEETEAEGGSDATESESASSKGDADVITPESVKKNQ